MNALGALDTDDLFFAFNGDILTDLDLTEMLARHHGSGRGGDDRAHARR